MKVGSGSGLIKVGSGSGSGFLGTYLDPDPGNLYPDPQTCQRLPAIREQGWYRTGYSITTTACARAHNGKCRLKAHFCDMKSLINIINIMEMKQKNKFL